MISSIKPDTTHAPAKPTTPEAAPRTVTIVCAEAHDGRLPVVVTVVPVADLEVTGVFVDYRKGSVPGETSAIQVGGEHKSTIKQGDAAVAALAAREVKAAAAAPAAPPVTDVIEPDDKTRQVAAMPEDAETPKAHNTKHPLVSHQISPGLKLTLGQAETIRADVALPSAPAEGETWFARGRFATNGGHDLSSAWTRI